MKSTGLSIALMATLGLSGCLEATKVASPPPSIVEQEEVNAATLNLPRTALAELARSADQLIIRAFKVDNGALGSELRAAWEFPVTEAGLYALDGLPLGEVEFLVELLDEKNQPLAEGTLRTVINPGSQTLPQLILKPIKPTAIDLDFRLALQLVNFPDVPVTLPAEPEALRTLLKTYRCQTCHNSGAKPSGGLDLQSYPYKNAAGESLAQILSKMSSSFTGSNGLPKMPPTPTQVKDEDAAVVRNFLQTIQDANSTGNQQWVRDVRLSLALGGTSRFETVLTPQDGAYVVTDRVNLIAGSRYTYTLIVYGPGGSRLHEVTDGTLDVPLNGRVEIKLDVVYQAPAVTLPVVVDE
ncbi:MAG: hypothetical protein M3Q07_15600 [Pseudobdellovibrionaceae bacterium]|nr:hypothetical protein [Pseudobdellovibrionaceae bacterium]